MQNPVTATGKTMDDVRQTMTRLLEPDAYSAVGGRSYLTDINPAYLREALVDCFGMAGYGWRLDCQEVMIEDTGAAEGKNIRYFGSMRVEICYLLLSEDGSSAWSEPLIGFGSGKSDHREDVLKSAKTNGIGDACKELLFQIDVYKGKVSHKSQGTNGGERRAPQTQERTSESEERAPMAIEKLKEAMDAKVRKIGNYTASDKFRGFVGGGLRALFPESQDADREAHTIGAFFFGEPSIKHMTGAQVKALRDWIDLAERGGDGLTPAPAAMVEAKAIIRQHMVDAGQEDMGL